MIENTTTSNQLNTNNYLHRNQAATTFSYSQSSQNGQKENFSFSSDEVNITYSSETITTYNSSMSLEGTQNDGYDMLRGLVLNIFEKQGIDYQFSGEDTEIDLSTLTQEEAQELVTDDGYFGVEQTSDRIFNFAIGIAGNDPTRIDAVREGVQQGFDEALDAFGGWLPDISYDTYDAVMNKLDEWVGLA